MKKWYKMAEEYVKYRFIEYRNYDNYSNGELIKLKDYDKITDDIVKDILDNINKNEETIVCIEGYNFGAKVGELIDLVTFSTLLRKKIYDLVTKNILVLSPATLKLEACKLTYKPIIKESKGRNKKIKYIYKNSKGISGGNFKKVDMFLSIVENNNLNDNWHKHCLSIKNDILQLSSIPKPYDDVNDAYLLYHIVKNKKNQII